MRAFLAALLFLTTFDVAAETIVYRNGRWFDGTRFVRRTMVSVDGVFSANVPQRVDRMIFLDEKFVIPPFAEGHNHWLEANAIAEYNRRYLGDGVFYVMDQANVPTVADRVRAETNRKDTVDYIAAVLGFTGPGGHPLQIMQQFVAMGLFPKEWQDAPDSNALFIVTSAEDVEQRWPLLREARPDFVKVFLLYSGEYETRKHDAAAGFDRGIDPKLVPRIVERAHADGLRISAHIYDAADFRNAVAAGVDLVAHMPGTGAGEHASELSRYRITDADARMAARKGVNVMTTLTWLNDTHDAERIEREVIAPNLRLLLRHRVPILIGSDQFRETPLSELFVLSRLGVMSNAEILRAATMTTPKAIFPSRRIGSFEEGSEASFLVLDANPLQDLHAVKTILLRVKKGAFVAYAASSLR